MTVSESVNRTVNLVATTIIGIAGFSFLHELGIETEVLFKLDDLVLAVLGISAIIWYKKGKNSTTRSFIPVVFVALGLLTKVVAIFLEISDKEDVGDDFGALILFVLATSFIYWLYKKAPKLHLSQKAS